MSTVYIIDDDPQVANMLGKFLNYIGYKNKIYTHANKYFSDNSVCTNNSIMVLDLNMPGMDGIEVMRKMAKTDRSLPLILISGCDSGVLHSAELLAKAHLIEIIATISKPFQFKYLKTVLQNYFKSDKKTTASLGINKVVITRDELKESLFNNQLELHYQPQIDIKSKLLVGVEALIRWNHPVHGLIHPNLFIPFAENNRMIGAITERVIKLAIDQAIIWRSMGLSLKISVKISTGNISSLMLPDQLSHIMCSKELDPSMLTLEVTESALMGELVTSLDILTRLRMKGLGLSIDDFGTGYCSLSQLYRAPFTELKIDKSFVMDMINDDEAKGIVRTCIALGHELNMNVVAEGVEDKETLDLLDKMDCDTAQGYYLAKPMCAEEIPQWKPPSKKSDAIYNLKQLP